MTAQLALPLTIRRGTEVQQVLRYFAFAFGAVFLLSFAVSLFTRPLITIIGSALASALIIVVLLWGMAQLLVRVMEPATITIDKTMVEVVPFAVYNIASDRPAERAPISAFRRVAVYRSRYADGNALPQCMFVARDSAARNVRFYPPKGLTAKAVAEQLNQLLGYHDKETGDVTSA